MGKKSRQSNLVSTMIEESAVDFSLCVLFGEREILHRRKADGQEVNTSRMSIFGLSSAAMGYWDVSNIVEASVEQLLCH